MRRGSRAHLGPPRGDRRRHRRPASKAWGCAWWRKPQDRSATVTAAWLPEGLEWAPFNADMRSRGLVVAGGQGKWAGRIMRFGHMGMVEIDEMVDAVRVMGETMGDHGFGTDVSRRLPGHPRRLRGIALRRRTVTARLLLVRHGVTTWNREGRFQGHLDPPLDPIGVEQARLLGDAPRRRGAMARCGSSPRP